MSTPSIKVLLVDDDEQDFIITRQLLTRIEEEQFEVEWVSNLTDARITLAEARHDVYLIDFKIGPESGMDLLLEARELGCSRPLIMFTNHGNFELDQQAIALGAADYLPKREVSSALLERTIRHAIERNLLMERLMFQATHDELTGLYNRKHLFEQLSSSISGAKRHGYDLSFCLADVDFFKEINDTYGHCTGDMVLTTFGSILREAVRTEDIPGRYGGDEFGIIFPHVTPQEAAFCTERIRTLLEKADFVDSCGNSFHVTATFGIAFLDDMELTAKDLIQAADKALYEAKVRGRNRTEVLS